MASSRAKNLGLYPASWIAAAQAAVASPERWQPFPVAMPDKATEPSPDTVHRRLRAFPTAFRNYPGYCPEVSGPLRAGGEFKFRRRVGLGVIRFEICFYPHRGRAIELVEKALAGG